MKNLEAILRANEEAMLQIYFEGGSLRVTLLAFDTLKGEGEVDGELSSEASDEEESIEELLALLEKQAEITLRENAAEVFWRARETEE